VFLFRERGKSCREWGYRNPHWRVVVKNFAVRVNHRIEGGATASAHKLSAGQVRKTPVDKGIAEL